MNDKKLECLLLSEPDLIEAGVLDMKRCVETMEEVFHIYATGDWLMSGPYNSEHGAIIQFPDHPKVFSMPRNSPDRRYVSIVGYLGGRFRACGGKFYGSNRENLEVGLPRSILTAFLNDTDTGAPLAIMSGNLISAMRTGAMPGVANKYLQAKGAAVIGIVGAGVISRACLLSLAETMPNCKAAAVYDIIPERSRAFAEEMSKVTALDVRPAESLEEMVRQSDAISLASSGQNPAHIKKEWLKDGACVLISGGGLLDDEVYLDPDTTLVIDCRKMHEIAIDQARIAHGTIDVSGKQFSSYQFFKLIEQGKLKIDRAAELGDIVSGKVVGRKNDRQRAIFMALGLSLEDVAWAWDMYQSALKKGLGVRFKFWDEPHWS